MTLNAGTNGFSVNPGEWVATRRFIQKISVQDLNGKGNVVSYTGAIKDIDLGVHNLTTTGAINAGQVNVDTMTIDNNTITDSTGTISFGDDNLATTGTASINSTLYLASGSITDSTGTISFGNENLITTGTVTINSTAPTPYPLFVKGLPAIGYIIFAKDSDNLQRFTLSNSGGIPEWRLGTLAGGEKGKITFTMPGVGGVGIVACYWSGAAYVNNFFMLHQNTKFQFGFQDDSYDTLTILKGTGAGTGKVGINQTTPTVPLDVTGDINATGSLSVGSITVASTLVLASGSITDTTGAITFVDENLSTGGWISCNRGSQDSNQVFGKEAMPSVSGNYYNTGLGYQAGYALTTGSSNTVIGYQALYSLTNRNHNVAIGLYAMYASTGGDRCISIGNYSLYNSVASDDNVAIGYEAGLTVSSSTGHNIMVGRSGGAGITTGIRNVAIGSYTLGANCNYSVAIGYNTGAVNTAAGLIAIGYYAGKDNTSGADNVFIGYDSGEANTTGGSNIGIGTRTLEANQTYSNNVAIGHGPLKYLTTGAVNTCIGTYAGICLIEGNHNFCLGAYTIGEADAGKVAAMNYNVAIGNYALTALNGGDDNIAIGYQSGLVLTTSSKNIFIGTAAGKSQTALAVEEPNIFIGYNTGYSTTTGYGNLAIGYRALYNNQTDQYNLAIGYEALYSKTDGVGPLGNYQLAIGYKAMRDGVSTGWYNLAIGALALQVLSTGQYNTAIGAVALNACTTGGRNTAIGPNAAKSLINGNYAIAIGPDAMYSSTTGDGIISIGYRSGYHNEANYNIAIGYFSLFSNTDADDCVAIGKQALYANTDGYSCVATGSLAGYSITTGSYNTAIGASALQLTTTTGCNTAIGASAMYNCIGATYSTALGCGSFYAGGSSQYSIALGYQCAYSADGDYSVFIGSQAAYNAFTDGISQNVVIGYQSGYGIQGSGNVFIGYQSAYSETGSNKLYVENSNSSSPLIYGEFDNDVVRINGRFSFKVATELTISSGVVTITGNYHTVDTESDSASDDLDTISGGYGDMILVLRAVNAARTVVCKDGTGNLTLASGADFSLDNIGDTITLIYDSTTSTWLELSRSNNN